MEDRQEGGEGVEVIAFDPVSVGYSHAMFNAAIVRALDAASIVEGVRVIVAKSALESKPFAGVAALPKVKDREALPEGSPGQGRCGQIRRSVGYHAQMSRAVRRRRSVVSVHLAADNLIAPLWLLFDRFVRGGCSYVILHNNAHGVRASRAIRLLWSGVFRAGVRPIVLAKSVCEFYDRLCPDTRFNLVPHPSYDDGTEPGVRNTEHRECDRRFLFLGRHGRSSTTVDFLGTFISACAAVRDGNPMTVVAERSVAAGVTEIARGSGVRLQMYDWPVEHDDYYRMVRAARFVVFPPSASDRISASGVHADATSYCVPIIAPAHGVFRENVPGSGAGLLYEDVESDLGRVVARAAGMSSVDYQRLRSDVAEVRRGCDVIRTAERLTYLLMAPAS